jgi:hypothetical protein
MSKSEIKVFLEHDWYFWHSKMILNRSLKSRVTGKRCKQIGYAKFVACSCYTPWFLLSVRLSIGLNRTKNSVIQTTFALNKSIFYFGFRHYSLCVIKPCMAYDVQFSILEPIKVHSHVCFKAIYKLLIEHLASISLVESDFLATCFVAYMWMYTLIERYCKSRKHIIP